MWRKIGLVLVGMFGALVLSAQVAGPPGLVGIVAGGLSQAAADALYVALAGGIMTGQLVNRLDPAGTALTDSSVLVNPAACGANEPLLGTGVAGVAGMTVDCEGDVSTVGEIQVSKNSNARNSVYVNNQNAGNAAGAELDADALGASMRSGALGTGNSGIAGTSIVGGDVYLIGNGSPLKFESTNGAITMATANTARLTIALGGGVTLSGALDAKGTISNSGASNSGRVYINDDGEVTGTLYLTNGTAALRVEGATNSYAYFKLPNSSGYEQITFLDQAGATKSGEGFGGTSTAAPYLGNAYSELQSGVAHRNLIAGAEVWSWDTNGLINSRTDKFNGDLMLNDIVRLPSATYAGTDCDAAAEVGRVVMHSNGTKITACICVQTAASTYSFTPVPVAAGVCP